MQSLATFATWKFAITGTREIASSAQSNTSAVLHACTKRRRKNHVQNQYHTNSGWLRVQYVEYWMKKKNSYIGRGNITLVVRSSKTYLIK